MKLKKRLIAVMAAAAMSVAVFTGCTSSAVTGSRYQEYIESGMKCKYYGELEGYKKACDATDEEAKEAYDSTIEYYANELMAYNGVSADYITSELYDKYVDVAEKIMAKAKFTVGKCTKVDGDWQLKIEISPMDINDITEDAIQKVMEAYNNAHTTDELNNSTDEQYAQWEEEFAQNILEVLDNAVSNIGYKDTVSKIVIITEDDDGYGITDDEWYDIDDIVVDMKGVF